MRRRALRPAFVVTFALGATAIAGGCSSRDSGNGNGSIGDSSIGDGSIGDSSIGDGSIGDSSIGDSSNLPMGCNPPEACYCHDACPSVDDAAPDVSDAGSDGEGQDGGHVTDATADVAPDAESE